VSLSCGMLGGAGGPVIPVVCTPLLGGRQYGAVCTLLEIGNTRLLLDCGRLFGTETEAVMRAVDEIVSGPIDAILLSHADMAHIGGLPSIFGSNGLSSCTLSLHLTL
jgi:cleavage and polyadenylation specificity factor subunit 2